MSLHDLIILSKKCEELEAKLEEAVEVIRFYATYMDGDNPQFTKSGWQKYPSPERAREFLAKVNGTSVLDK